MAQADRNGGVADIVEVETGRQVVGDETAKPKLTTHPMHCPKCNCEITKVVHHRKVQACRGSNEQLLVASDSTPDLVGCPYCLSLFTSPVSLSDGIKLISFKTEDQLDWFEAEYRRSLRVVATATNDPIRLDPKIAGEKYVPDWPIANKDTVVAPDLAKLFVYNLGTPADYLQFRSLGDSDISDLAMVNQARSNLLTSELHRRWVEAEVENTKLRRQLQHIGDVNCSILEIETRLWDPTLPYMHQFEELKKILDNATADGLTLQDAQKTLAKTKASLEVLIVTVEAQRKGFQTKIDELSKSYEKQSKLYAELAADQARLLAAEKEWQVKEADMNKAMSDIQHKFNQHVAEVNSLRDSIATLEKQKRWLLTTGVQHLSQKIRTSHEMMDAVAAVNNATNLCGFVQGIRAGYHYALEKKIPMETVPDLPQNVEQNLNLAVSEFDNLSIRFVTVLADHVESPFEEIKELLQAPSVMCNSS